MTFEQVKEAVDAGKTVHWVNKSYKIVKHKKLENYMIHMEANDYFSGMHPDEANDCFIAVDTH